MYTSIVNIFNIYVILQYKITIYEIRKRARTHARTHLIMIPGVTLPVVV